MKLSVKLPMDIMNILTPSPAPSKTSTSFKTPERHFEDFDETFSKVIIHIIVTIAMPFQYAWMLHLALLC